MTIPQFINLLNSDGHWVVSALTIMHNYAINSCIQVLMGTYVFNSPG